MLERRGQLQSIRSPQPGVLGEQARGSFENRLVDGEERDDTSSGEQSPVVLAKGMSSLANGHHEDFHQFQDARDTQSEPLSNGVEKVVPQGKILRMLFQVINEGSAVKGERLPFDSRSQASHASRSASIYSWASTFPQISLPSPRSSVISCSGSSGVYARERRRRSRSSLGSCRAAWISSSTVRRGGIQHLFLNVVYYKSRQTPRGSLASRRSRICTSSFPNRNSKIVRFPAPRAESWAACRFPRSGVCEARSGFSPSPRPSR